MTATITIPRFSANQIGRDFAVGDIHGAFDALAVALIAIEFNPSMDRLFSVGDLVDRGPDSHKVIEWLSLPWFHAVCGNHDFLAWRSALGDPFPDVDHRKHGGDWLGRLPTEHQREIGERLSALPIALEVETMAGRIGVVHANCPFKNWERMRELDLDELDQMESPVGQCLWSFARYDHRYRGIVRSIRAVLHGHITVPITTVLGNSFFIDTGGWLPKGRFTFLNLETLDPVLAPVQTSPMAQTRRR